MANLGYAWWKMPHIKWNTNNKFLVKKFLSHKIIHVLYHYEIPSYILTRKYEEKCTNSVYDTKSLENHFISDMFRWHMYRHHQGGSYTGSRDTASKAKSLLLGTHCWWCHCSQAEHCIDSHSSFVTFFTAVAVIIFVRISRVRIVNHFREIILNTFGFYFLLLDDWRISENVSMKISLYPWWLWVW
jgi:hypothetical protein